MSETLKQCKKCGRMLPVENFYTNKNGNPTSPCKDCAKEREKIRFKKHYDERKLAQPIPATLTPIERYEKRKKEQGKLVAKGKGGYERTDFERLAREACMRRWPSYGNYFAFGFVEGAKWIYEQLKR